MDPQSVEQRFWEKVERRGPDDCWLWTGGTMSTGYGIFNACEDGVSRVGLAHRFAYEFGHGETIPSSLFVCHECDVKLCVNPVHLHTGTPADNVHEAVERNLWKRGEDRSDTKLSDAEVRAIRSAPDGQQHALAREYGVSQQLISLIRAGKRRWFVA